MKKKRRQYTKEFKIETVRLISEGGHSVSEVAKNLGVSESTVRLWRKQYMENAEQIVQGKELTTPNKETSSSLDFGEKVIGILNDIFNHPLLIILALLAAFIPYAIFVYYKTSGSPDVYILLFVRCLSFLFCTPLLAMPVWYAFEYGFMSSKVDRSYKRPPLYAALIIVYGVVPIFLLLLGGGVSYPFLQNLVAPFLCPIGYEGVDTGFFYMPVKTGTAFCKGEYGALNFTLLASNPVFIGVYVPIFAFITSCLLIAARIMRKINIKNNAVAAVLITALYIALFGMFAYQQTKIRPYVQSVNFNLNEKHYGNFLYFESSKGNIDKVKRVLDAGVDPNIKHYAGGVPIIFAAQLGKADIVELLLDYGAEATNTDSRGKTVLDYAIEHANNGSNEFAGIVKRLRNEKGIPL